MEEAGEKVGGSVGRGQQVVDVGDRILAGHQVPVAINPDDIKLASDVETEWIDSDQSGCFDVDLPKSERQGSKIGRSILVHEATDRRFVVGERVRKHHRLAIDRELTELAEINGHQGPADIWRIPVVDPPAIGEMSMVPVLLEPFKRDHQLDDLLLLIVGFLREVQGAVARSKHRLHHGRHDPTIGCQDDTDRHVLGIEADEPREVASKKCRGGPDVWWECIHDAGVYLVKRVAR
jgi:hypothetical protein